MMRAYLSNGFNPYLKISINEYAVFSDRSPTSTSRSKYHSVGFRNRMDSHSHFPLLVNRGNSMGRTSTVAYSGGAFALYAGDRGSIPSRDKPRSLK